MGKWAGKQLTTLLRPQGVFEARVAELGLLCLWKVRDDEPWTLYGSGGLGEVGGGYLLSPSRLPD